jgi:hypothetical protein
MFQEIHIFDFDGTLFKSPVNSPENIKMYEETTGIPWIIDKDKSIELTEKLGIPIKTRSGWFGRSETLKPPIVPSPAPLEWFNPHVVAEFIKSKSDENMMTCLMTGRHLGLKKYVIRICKEGNLFQDENEVSCFFSGEDGPDPQGEKPKDTLGWKLWIARQLLKTNSGVKRLVFWEDRTEHVQPFLDLQKEGFTEEVVVNHVACEDWPNFSKLVAI